MECGPSAPVGDNILEFDTNCTFSALCLRIVGDLYPFHLKAYFRTVEHRALDFIDFSFTVRGVLLRHLRVCLFAEPLLLLCCRTMIISLHYSSKIIWISGIRGIKTQNIIRFVYWSSIFSLFFSKNTNLWRSSRTDDLHGSAENPIKHQERALLPSRDFCLVINERRI